ncbi:MAG TPA: hypothetical protein VES68_03440 [Candidatus Sulfotelmatobacter sp.]|nr:hypothetical protein [Candidatus Sulfotelmatobacter sp.]
MAEDKSEQTPIPPGDVITGDPVIEDLPYRPFYDTPETKSAPSKSDDAKTAMIIDVKSDKYVYSPYSGKELSTPGPTESPASPSPTPETESNPEHASYDHMNESFPSPEPTPTPTPDWGECILGDVTLDSGRHYYDSDAYTGLVTIVKDEQPIQTDWSADIYNLTGCANVEDFLRLVSELNPQEPHSPSEPPTPTLISTPTETPLTTPTPTPTPESTPPPTESQKP